MRSSLTWSSANLIGLFLLGAIPAFGTVYEVGPGCTYARIADSPTHALEAGDTLKVYARAEPYREVFFVHGQGTEEAPIVVLGVADAAGNKPVIDGRDAVVGGAADFWNEDRQLIKIGQYETHRADWVVIDGFVLRFANSDQQFTDKSGARRPFLANASGIRPEYADHVTIRHCEIYGNGNGVQNGAGEPQELLVEYCDIRDNGAGRRSAFEHNLYLAVGGPGSRAVVQFCRVGALASDGQQLKTRVETALIRYNWIEGGANSQIDLVDHPDNGRANAYVYGNIIIKPERTNNGRFIHFGQDLGNERQGTLYFFNNTCILRAGSSFGRLFEISSAGAEVEARYNIFYQVGTADFSLRNGFDQLSGQFNWLSDAIRGEGLDDSLVGQDPGFVNAAGGDFRLAASSPCVDVVGAPLLPMEVERQYEKHLQGGIRPRDGALDLGAWERPQSTLVPADPALVDFYLTARPNPFNGQVTIGYDLPQAGPVQLAVYSAMGQRVRWLVQGAGQAGRHEAAWDGRDDSGRPAASGIYLCALVFAQQRQSRQLVLLR
ncbi:MAG: hypothetical protein GKR89_06165 [Candidatus Latescibacteria bacterium]|nr:hypothetical protein [Candidatus Latescibacterota bacterium]